MRRKALLTLAAAAGIIALAMRIWSVNASAFEYPVEVSGLNEEVELKGAFAEYAYENTDGYSVRVTAARRMSIAEYIDAYSLDKDAAQVYRSGVGDVTDDNAKTLIVLDIEMANKKAEGSERGYLDSIGWSIKSADHPESWIRAESGLLGTSIPQANGAYQMSIRPQSSYVLHVPFVETGCEPSFPARDGEVICPELGAGDYEFVITKAPVRKVVAFSVE